MTPKQMRAARYEAATEKYQKCLREIQRKYKYKKIGVYDYTIEYNDNERIYLNAVEEINLEIRKEKEQNERV